MREIGNVVQVPGHPTAPYRMYYSAHVGTYSETAQIEIFMATSLDGSNWKAGTAPIISDRFLEDPYVVQAPDGSWELYAEDKTANPQRYIRVYRSSDGLTGWTDLGDAGIPVGGSGAWNQLDVSSPVVWLERQENGTQRRYCLFEGRTPGQDGAIGLAWTENADPTQPWTVHPAPVAIPNNPGFFGAATPVTPWAQVLVPDDITRSGSTYLMLAHAFTLDHRWVPALLTSTDLINWTDAVSHELVNGMHQRVPAETWMFGVTAGTVIYTNGQGIYLAQTALEAVQEVTLQYDSTKTSNRLLLKPGRHVFYDLKIIGDGTFGMVRVKDANSGDGGFVDYESNFATRPYPWGVDVPANAGGGEGYVMDIPCTTSGAVTASFRLVSALLTP